MKLALFSKFFSPVLQFLNEDILDVDPDVRFALFVTDLI